MNKNILVTLFLMIMSISTYSSEGFNNVTKEESVLLNTTQNQIKVKTIRGILGNNDPLLHTRGQVRAGYIHFNQKNTYTNRAYGLAGHIHFDTKRWYGLQVGLSAYGVLNLATNHNPLHVNPDFFDAKGNNFAQLTEAYLDGKWGETEIMLGRQILDTPHADSDDIRMIPNYFEAYTFTNKSIKNLTLGAGFIRQMAGWENSVDAQQFVNIGKTLGTSNIDGIFYTSAEYEGIKDISLSLWYYNYHDIAEVFYAELGYERTLNDNTSLTLGLQYDSSQESGVAKLGTQDAQTYGISMELASEAIGIHILAAYNKDTGNTGATGLNLGGGALFTSMEDQTLDALGQSGEAWILGAGYHFSTMGINGLNAGVAYGKFTANNALDYTSKELDVVVEYEINKHLSFTLAYADVSFSDGLDDNNQPLQDYSQVRFIGNYNFKVT